MMILSDLCQKATEANHLTGADPGKMYAGKAKIRELQNLGKRAVIWDSERFPYLGV
jgi:hypothetical protein